jgi:sodium-dependent dicarboxylate transporter 2/3/5
LEVPLPPANEDLFNELIRKEYNDLGPYTWEQKSIGSLFLVAVVLWLTRDLNFAPGWGALFKDGFLTDASAAILVLFFCAAWPKENCFRRGVLYQPLLSWKEAERIFQWNVILLLGGSLAMAEGVEKSGLSKWIGEILTTVLPDNRYLSMFLMMLVSVVGTEVFSCIKLSFFLYQT